MKATTTSNKFALAGLCAVMTALVLVPDQALAGTGGSEFDEVWEVYVDWVQGTLGRVIVGFLILVGIVAGIIRQSLMSFAVGIGAAMGLYYSPQIVEGIMSATLPHAPDLMAGAQILTNGLGM